LDASKITLVDFNADGLWDLRVMGLTEAIFVDGEWQEIVSYKKKDLLYEARSQEGQEYIFVLTKGTWEIRKP
jgi:hypothetical protein